MVEIKMSKEERERGVRTAAELYHKMNLEPMPGVVMEAEYWKKERWWRKEKEHERKDREKKERKKKQQEEDWRASDRKNVCGFLERRQDLERGEASRKEMRDKLAEERKTNTEAKRRRDFIEMVTSEYKDVTI